MTAPFQVKTFPQRGDVAGVMNEWFDTLAQDPENEYDIRQILNTGIDLLVFYEVTPAVPEPVVQAAGQSCCDTCGSELDVRHVCKDCDTRGEHG